MSIDQLAYELGEIHRRSHYQARTANVVAFAMVHADEIAPMDWNQRQKLVKQAGVPGTYNDHLRVGAQVGSEILRPNYILKD